MATVNERQEEIIEEFEGLDDWMDRYNPYIGKMQDLMYDFYLRQHRIEGGRKNYSAVVGLLIAWDERQKVSP